MNVRIKIHSKCYTKSWDETIIEVSRVPCIGETVRVKNSSHKVVNVVHENGEIPFVVLED